MIRLNHSPPHLLTYLLPPQLTFLTKQLSNNEFINISTDEWSKSIAPNSRILRNNLTSSFADLKIKNKSIQEIDCSKKIGSHLNSIHLKGRFKVFKIFIVHVFYIFRIFTSEMIDSYFLLEHQQWILDISNKDEVSCPATGHHSIHSILP